MSFRPPAKHPGACAVKTSGPLLASTSHTQHTAKQQSSGCALNVPQDAAPHHPRPFPCYHLPAAQAGTRPHDTATKQAAAPAHARVRGRHHCCSWPRPCMNFGSARFRTCLQRCIQEKQKAGPGPRRPFDNPLSVIMALSQSITSRHPSMLHRCACRRPRTRPGRRRSTCPRRWSGAGRHTGTAPAPCTPPSWSTTPMHFLFSFFSHPFHLSCSGQATYDTTQHLQPPSTAVYKQQSCKKHTASEQNPPADIHNHEHGLPTICTPVPALDLLDRENQGGQGDMLLLRKPRTRA